jgi:hypothetical protein
MQKTGAVVSRAAGITLVEVLAAIFITGIGLLALLTLFPLGALELAEAIKDDRTAALASNTVAFSEQGEGLVSRTAQFVTVSLANGSADPQIAALLREEYGDLADHAAVLEAQIRELWWQLPPPQAQPHLARLLAQLKLIQRRIDFLVWLLSLLEQRDS